MLRGHGDLLTRLVTVCSPGHQLPPGHEDGQRGGEWAHLGQRPAALQLGGLARGGAPGHAAGVQHGVGAAAAVMCVCVL